MMDRKFTEKINDWLLAPKEERDYAAGALMLLQLSGNQVMYRNLAVRPETKADFIEYQLQKYYNFRVRELTHEQVIDMSRKVEEIAKDNLSLSIRKDSAPKKGKRDDHDSLPDEIKQLYVENLDIVHRMRELHLKLRSLSLDKAPCPDSERYPFLVEIIRLDKKMHANWKRYDSYIPDETVG